MQTAAEVISLSAAGFLACEYETRLLGPFTPGRTCEAISAIPATVRPEGIPATLTRCTNPGSSTL